MRKKSIVVAAIQLSPTENEKRNISKAYDALTHAAEKGVDIVALPELFHFRGSPRLYSRYAHTESSEIISLFRDCARKYKVDIVLGSIIEECSRTKKRYDTSLVINAKGMLVARYRKNNLFKVKLSQRIIDESRYFSRDNKSALVRMRTFQCGLAICFDIRFPMLFRSMREKGADLFFLPSNFTHKTGQAHWHALVRARAIETQSYIIAPNCCGRDPYTGIKSYGHSLIVDPWGEIIAAAGDKPTIVYAKISKKRINETRRIMPLHYG